MTKPLSPGLSGLLSLLVVLGLWEAATHLFKIPIFLVPPPSAVIAEIAGSVPFYIEHTLVTLRAVLIGFVLSVLIGLLLAVVFSYSRLARATLYPLVLLLQGVPKIALAPILIVFFGFGLQFQVVVIVSVAFFPVVINAVQGLEEVEPDLIVLSRVLCTPRVKEFWMIGLPSAAPSLFAGMKLAMTLSVIGAVVAEFVSSKAGLGNTLLRANADFNPAMGFAAVVLLSLMSFALFGLIRLAEIVLVPWSNDKGFSLAA